MSLLTRRLGRSGPAISVLGAGSWAIGGGGWAYSWGGQDDAESIAAIVHAVERGVSWIDTAAVYGLGHAEEVVGRAIRALPEDLRPLVFTKCGVRWDPENPMRYGIRRLQPESIREECDASLRRLGVEAIDLYQFHWPDEAGTPVEDSWGEMARLVEAGKIRHAGVSNFTVALLERCEPVLHVNSLQPPFSALRRSAAEDVIPWCRDHGTGVICYSPMQAGILTDSFGRERVAAMDDGDWRRNDARFNEPALTRNLAFRDALRPIAERHGSTVAAVAVAWVLAWPGVTGAIVGSRSAAQVDGWLPAAALRLSDDDLDEVADALERTGAGEGPTRPGRTATARGS